MNNETLVSFLKLQENLKELIQNFDEEVASAILAKVFCEICIKASRDKEFVLEIISKSYDLVLEKEFHLLKRKYDEIIQSPA